MSILKGWFGKTADHNVKSKNKKVLLLNRSKFVDALLQSLPKKNSWILLEPSERAKEALMDESLELVIFSFPEIKKGWTEEIAAAYVKDSLFSLLEWLEHFQTHPPTQFLLVSSWKAGDPESVLGAIYRNGEVLVEGYARATGKMAKSLRRMQAKEDTKARPDALSEVVGTMLLNWLSNEMTSGTYKMNLSEETGGISMERLKRSDTDFAVSKKIMANMKELLDSGQYVEGLLYLKQLHTRMKE